MVYYFILKNISHDHGILLNAKISANNCLGDNILNNIFHEEIWSSDMAILDEGFKNPDLGFRILPPS